MVGKTRTDMKNNLFILFAVAAIAAVSCAKEINLENNDAQNPNLVPVTLTATGEDTKAIFSGYPKIAWEGNEEISLLGTNTGNQKFTAEAKGHETTLSGLADLSDETFYAVYPYDANVSLSENGQILNVTVPAIQTARAGSFDPKAYIAVAKSTDKETLNFKAVGGFVKFKLEDAENVKSVTMVSNAGNNMACSAAITFKDDGSVSHGTPYIDGTASSSVKMIGDFESEKAYFMVVRPQPYTGGVTFYIEYKDGTILSRKGESELFESGKGRNFIRNLNTLQKKDFKPASDLYTLYNLGYDIKIAGKSYSPTELGSATLVTESTTISANGVYFIAEGVDIQISKGPYSKLFVIGNSVNSKTNITLTEQVRYSTNGIIGFKNLAFAQYSTDMFVHNNTAEATRFAFDNCDIITPTSNGVMYNGGSRTLAEFAMYNCNIEVTKDSHIFLRTSANYSNIDLHNNIFYSAEGDKMDFYLINYSSNATESLKLTQNTFANVYNITSAGGQNPYINIASVANYTLENNLFYLESYNSYKNPTSWILSCVPAASTINNNMLFKDVNNPRLQVYKGGAYTTYTATKANVVTGEVDLSVPTIVPATTAGATR